MGFTRSQAILDGRFALTAAVLDMSNAACLLDKLMHIIIIIASVHADMLFNFSRVMARNDNRDNQVVRRPFIMSVRAGNVHGQRRTPFVTSKWILLPCWPRSVELRPVASPPNGAGQLLLSIACPFHLTLCLLA
jgi:hypothetical protein